MTDRFRQPDKILEAAERLVPLMIDLGVRQARPRRGSADRLLAAQGRRRLHVRRGLPHLLLADAEGRDEGPDRAGHRAGDVRRGRLQQASGGDRRRRAARRAASCGCSTRPTWRPPSVLSAATPASPATSPARSWLLGTPDEVERYVTDLLDACATDGGFFLRNGAVLDDAKAGEPEGHDRDRARLARLRRRPRGVWRGDGPKRLPERAPAGPPERSPGSRRPVRERDRA